jgi:mannose/fructose/N-acetylgalactosamine-specific phosphotransferase system component IIC
MMAGFNVALLAGAVLYLAALGFVLRAAAVPAEAA